MQFLNADWVNSLVNITQCINTEKFRAYCLCYIIKLIENILPYKKRIADISENWKKKRNGVKIPPPSGVIFPHNFSFFLSSTCLYRTVYQHEKYFKCQYNRSHEQYFIASLLQEKQKYPGIAFVIEVIRVYINFTPSFNTLVAILKSGIFCTNRFEANDSDNKFIE